jgi:glutathione-independent formaldehyde dehydrogenase
VTDTNRGVVYKGPGEVAVEDLPFPTLERHGRPMHHGVILKVIATNICGSDLHMVRGRTTAKPGLRLGHEMTGEVIECGADVEFVHEGDLVSVPFNVACGRCRNCRERHTHICETVNDEGGWGGAYGYVGMGTWPGGQAKYAAVPYADFNLLKFPADRDTVMAKMLDLSMLSDIFPTGYHGAYTAGVFTGSTVYVAGPGPVGLACATACFLLGAAVVIVGGHRAERLAQARSFGCETIDLTRYDDLAEPIEQILGVPEVDAGVDCVGFEARGHGAKGVTTEQPAIVLNTLMKITRAPGRIGVPGYYAVGDPGAEDEAARMGMLALHFGLGWNKAQSFHTGQCPVMRYNRELMMAILHDRTEIARNVNATVIPLEKAPEAYREFGKGAARKYVLDPHDLLVAG